MVDRHADIVEQTRQLLEPGDIELVGLVVHTGFTPDEEPELLDETVEIGERIASHLVDEPTYVYSGNDDPRFAINQHQGLTAADDAFVWECQHVLRDGTFDVVFYYESAPEHRAVVEELRDRGYAFTVVEP
ncbi:MAG: DUF5778 family protein [Halobacteriales archaeon]